MGRTREARRIGYMLGGLALLLALGLVALFAAAAEVPAVANTSLAGMLGVALAGFVAIGLRRPAVGASPIVIGILLAFVVILAGLGTFLNRGLGAILGVCTIPSALVLLAQTFSGERRT